VSTTARSHRQFVEANAALRRPPLVPEIVLRLAPNVLPLWELTETLGPPNSPPPYWAFAWPGGQAVARYILDNAADFEGRTALDFGAGSGLVGIACVLAGASAIAAEIDPFAQAAIHANAEANSVHMTLVSDDIIGRDDGWDIVCLGDMCYERPLAERLLPWLENLVGRGARVYLGDPGRNYFPGTGVRKLATYSVPTSRDLEDREIRETSIYILEPK
jgi:predicted nicotinamide N-methyase